MTMTFTYAWWWIPTALTVAVVIWGLLPESKQEEGLAVGLTAIFWAAPILLFLGVVWAIAGAFK